MRYCKVVLIILFMGCSNDQSKSPALFSDVTIQSGVDFQNDLTFTERMNPYTYRNFYNGAGVAIGDINNDGLDDIFFAGNQVDNKLYLNKGNLAFEDITLRAGVASEGVWSTGVTFVDVNADGWLDVYVCKSGDPETPRRHNELFINNGDLTFTERSKEFGLDIIGLSVQAAFFDFDKDGDLDCYLLTNSIKSVGQYDLVLNQREIPDPLGGGNKFLINENGKFRDHSREAGIYHSNIGFGLGITLGDFNHDSWTDIFVSNDFFERDYLYINDRDGSFTESLTDYFQSISMGSMGADYADLDNDGLAELFVTEMLPDSLSRKKTKTLYESWDKYQLNVSRGYYHQFPRNVLQKQVSKGNFVEVGRLAGISASEWSWGALLFDMDNDGLRDIFVANGIYKDLLDRDYLAYSADDENVRKIIRAEDNAILKLIDMMPSSAFSNYAFRNEGNLRFSNVASEWGLAAPMYSCGSAYGDLDNDGDLDLVVNNINSRAVVYRNNTDPSKHKNLSLSFSMKGGNSFALGTEVTAYVKDKIFYGDNFVTRGFQSAGPPKITLGLGAGASAIDSLLVRWPDNRRTWLYNVAVNQMLVVRHEDSEEGEAQVASEAPPDGALRLEKVNADIFRHAGSGLVDFNRDRLLPMMYSNESPALHRADLNGDGVAEIYVGGGRGQPGAMIHLSSEGIRATPLAKLDAQSMMEETRGTFVDVDGDGDLDFYMASGGRFFPNTSDILMDKIFLNDGAGRFTASKIPLPFKRNISTSVVKAIDFDNDGDKDLVVAERFDPFVYGLGGRGFLFQNDGTGTFTDVTATVAPTLMNPGMITDVEVIDYDNDGWQDISVTGDWMPVIMMKNETGKFVDVSDALGLKNSEGWWRDIEARDLNQDGKPDFVLANHGLNTFFKPGDRMYVNDFDGNGSVEQIFCTELNGAYYPIVDKDELLSQLPSFKKSLLYYKDYGKKSIEKLFDQTLLEKSRMLQVNKLSSMILLSAGERYEQVDLPVQAQYSPIYALCIADVDGDGVDDVIAGGNNYQVKPQFGRYDGSNGWFFKGALKEGKYTLTPGVQLNVRGQIRDIELVDTGENVYILFAKYDDELEIYRIVNRDNPL